MVSLVFIFLSSEYFVLNERAPGRLGFGHYNDILHTAYNTLLIRSRVPPRKRCRGVYSTECGSEVSCSCVCSFPHCLSLPVLSTPAKMLRVDEGSLFLLDLSAKSRIPGANPSNTSSLLQGLRGVSIPVSPTPATSYMCSSEGGVSMGLESGSFVSLALAVRLLALYA
jgi:hypothetical protein